MYTQSNIMNMTTETQTQPVELTQNSTLSVNLTKKQIEACPTPNQDKCIDLQFKEAYKGFYSM